MSTKWPPKIQKAEDRMWDAKAALQADIDSKQSYNVKRRNHLMDEFNRAMASFESQVNKLAKKSKGPEHERR
jgi:hypothetical protein